MCLSAIGMIVQGQQANDLAKAQAKALNQQAKAERHAAAFDAMREQEKQSYARSSAIAQVGASGVGLAGSPTDVLVEQAGQDQMELEAIKYGGQVRANTLKTQAAITKFQGKQAQTASYINAGTSAITDIAKIAMGGSPFA